MNEFEQLMVVEQRASVDITDPGYSRGRPDGYGAAGAGFWSQGMTWNGMVSSAATPESAMRLSAVFACLRLLSEAIATLPLDTFTRDNGTRKPYRPRPDYLSFQPPQGPRTDYLSGVLLSLLTDGNAFVATPRDNFGVPLDLVPLDPVSIEVHRQTSMPTDRLPYRLGEIYFTFGGHHFSQSEIMHIKGMCLAGSLRGVSPIKAARDVLSGAQKAQDFGINLFDNNSVPPAVIELADPPDAAGQAKAARISESWQQTNGGTSNAGKVGILLGGAQLKTIAVTPEDAQWLDTRKFGIQEIARFYGVPPHLIADSSNSTSWGSGLEEQNLAFGQLTLRPWIERIEEAHGRLLTTHGLPDVFIKLNLDALLRASLTDRYASYSVGIASGFLTINEARRLEDLPPVSWGDERPPLAPGGAQ